MIQIYAAGKSAALSHACTLLKEGGYNLQDVPTQETTHLLLPIPSLESENTIKGGISFESLRSSCPNAIIIGGMLPNCSCRCIDLLDDVEYVAENAAITAHCAIRFAMERMPYTFINQSVLIIGWGRIGKCLARLLRNLDANVTIAARKPTDRALASALGYNTIDTTNIQPKKYTIIFNTAPHLILSNCPGDILAIDLASKPGITGSKVLAARGLPGKMVPYASGWLIYKTIIRYIQEGKL